MKKNPHQTFQAFHLAASILLGAGILSLSLVGLSAVPAVAQEQITEAVAVIHPTEGNACHGVVHFKQVGELVKVTADIDGLEPNGRHGFHIHQFGDATAANGTSAGGHFNPGGHPHALPPSELRHAGDLGNLTADANGHASYEMLQGGISVHGDKPQILGRGVIVHAQVDDGGQPTGNAGARIGIGVIGIANPAE